MSAVAQHQIPVKQQLVRDSRRARIVALVTVTIIAAVLAAVGLVAGRSDSPTAASAPSQVEGTAPIGGIRYDGGPEEGLQGVVTRHPQPGVRYDGGPEEGTSGAVH